MEQFSVIVIKCVIFGIVTEVQGVDLSLPKNLLIGASSSSHQIEGAWNVSGKGEDVWDWWTHNDPTVVADGKNADIACNAYYKYKEDVQRIKSIGLDVYRFSVSWARIIPTGFADVINEEGLQYYKNLTRELIANGIEPIVTMYHWDHPQIIEMMGGWVNEVIVDLFVDYARILFEALGDKVKIWTTINEPDSFCEYGYEGTDQKMAPGKYLPGMGKYLCGQNVLKAHAETYHMYNREFRAAQQGQIGIVLSCWGYIPANPSDTVSAETAFQFGCGWLGHPIFLGDYPEIMKKRVAMISKSQGYSESRLPELSNEWISRIKGTTDYFGVNHYTTLIVSPDPDEELGIYNTDAGLIMTVDPSWPGAASSQLFVYPPGFGILLRKIKDEYDNPPVRVMENGYSDYGGLEDYDRIKYHHGYMEELILAIERDGCNVQSYCFWTIMDAFEWNSGYTQKFGIVSVDFEDPNRTRTPKLSASWFQRVLATRKLQPVPTPPEPANHHLESCETSQNIFVD